MKFVTIFLRHASLQFLWGTLIAIAIIYVVGITDVVRLSNTLFVTAVVLIFFSRAFFSPKELGFRARRSLFQIIPRVDFEPTNNEDDDMKFSEEEKKKYSLIYWLIIYLRTWGISFTLIFYAIFVHQIFRN